MANGVNGIMEALDSKAPTYKFWLGVSGIVIAGLLTIISTLTMMGVSSIQASLASVKAESDQRCKELEKKDSLQETEMKMMLSRMYRVEILITMNFNDRMKALNNLQKLLEPPK